MSLIDEIKSRLEPGEFARLLGVDLIDKGVRWHLVPCPICGSSKTPAHSVRRSRTTGKWIYNCWSCNTYGDVFDIWRAYMRATCGEAPSMQDTIKDLAVRLGIPTEMTYTERLALRRRLDARDKLKEIRLGMDRVDSLMMACPESFSLVFRKFWTERVHAWVDGYAKKMGDV